MFNLFKRDAEKQDNELALTFVKGSAVTYKEVLGFFLYNEEVFYKPKNGAGKNVKTSENFTDYVIRLNPDVAMTSKDISIKEVTPLIFK